MKKPRIVILNSSSFAKHHQAHLQRLEAFAEVRRVTVPQDVSDDQLLQELQGVNGIIASVTPKISRKVLEGLPELVLIARHGIGCDNVDLSAATDLGILVSRVDGPVERHAVAEHAVALMMACARYIVPAVDSVKTSNWEHRSRYIGLELSFKTIGLIGLGNIGSRVAEILARGFDARVLAYDPLLDAASIRARGAEPASLEDLISESAIVSLHCPLNDTTRRLFNAERLAALRPGAILINTCRGELLDESALIERLEAGALRAYGTDVVEGEPIDGTHRLLRVPNVIVVPHLGGYTEESLKGMGETMVSDSESVFVHGSLPGTIANAEVTRGEHRRWA